MSDKKEKLFMAMNEIDSSLLERSEVVSFTRKRSFTVLKAVELLACACVLFAVGFFSGNGFFDKADKSASENEAACLAFDSIDSGPEFANGSTDADTRYGASTETENDGIEPVLKEAHTVGTAVGNGSFITSTKEASQNKNVLDEDAVRADEKYGDFIPKTPEGYTFSRACIDEDGLVIVYLKKGTNEIVTIRIATESDNDTVVK